MVAEDRNLLILDLDETLFFATESAKSSFSSPPDFRFLTNAVFLRPGVQEFIDRMSKIYEFAIWTSSSPVYADFFRRRLFESVSLQFVWASDRYTFRFDHERQSMHAIKDFRKLRRKEIDLQRVLAVDDSPEKHVRNYGNLVRIDPFGGEPNDCELFRLIPYLESIRSIRHFRFLDKRSWRDSATSSNNIP